MASVSFFVFFVLSHLLLLHSAEAEKRYNPNPNCPPFRCGELSWVGFPFANSTNPECGVVILHDCNPSRTPKIQLEKNGKPKLYDVERIHPPYDYVEDMSQADHTIAIKDEDLSKHLNHNSCDSFHNLTIPSLPLPSYISFQITELFNKTLFKCNRTGNNTFFRDFFNYNKCGDYNIYYSRNLDPVDELPPHCSIIQLPLSFNEAEHGDGSDLFKLLTAELQFDVRVYPDCFDCHWRGGQCLTNSKGKYYCAEKKGIDMGKMQKYITTHTYAYINS